MYLSGSPAASTCSLDNKDFSDDDFELSDDQEPYLMVQRQFEDDDAGICYMETTITTPILGNFRLRLLRFTRRTEPT